MAYSDAEKAEALIRLALNKYDFAKTAQDTGMEIHTLRRWNKNAPKKGVADLLDRALAQILMSIPEKIDGRDWGVIVGILMDKWLLVQGKATSRSESIKRLGINDNELDELLAEANQILEDTAAGGGADQGAGESEA